MNRKRQLQVSNMCVGTVPVEVKKGVLSGVAKITEMNYNFCKFHLQKKKY